MDFQWNIVLVNKALSLKNEASRYVIFNKSTMLRKIESTILLLLIFETKKVKLYINLGLLFLHQWFKKNSKKVNRSMQLSKKAVEYGA